MHTHRAAVRFSNFPGPLRSIVLFLGLGLLLHNMSTFDAQSCRRFREKRWTDGRTDIRTHTQTDYNNPPPAYARARVNKNTGELSHYRAPVPSHDETLKFSSSSRIRVLYSTLGFSSRRLNTSDNSSTHLGHIGHIITLITHMHIIEFNTAHI